LLVEILHWRFIEWTDEGNLKFVKRVGIDENPVRKNWAYMLVYE